MDGLDVPLVGFLRTGFREEHSENEQPITRPEGTAEAAFGAGLLPIGQRSTATSPIFNYPYERTRDALRAMSIGGDPDPHAGFALRYVNPTNGDWAIPTVVASLRLLPRDFRTRPYRSTDGAVLVVVEGKVKAEVGGQSFELSPKDTLAIPAWSNHTLEASE
jgi:gentisate 1,2-dioxygenase